MIAIIMGQTRGEDCQYGQGCGLDAMTGAHSDPSYYVIPSTIPAALRATLYGWILVRFESPWGYFTRPIT